MVCSAAHVVRLGDGARIRSFLNSKEKGNTQNGYSTTKHVPGSFGVLAQASSPTWRQQCAPVSSNVLGGECDGEFVYDCLRDLVAIEQ
jgi:hypothetical protein